MMFSSSEAEQLVFEKIAKDFERQGYQFVQAEDVELPKDKWRYIPDFIAKKGDEYIAIEVKYRRTRSVEKSLEKLKGLIEENNNWKFRVFYAEDELATKSLSRPNPSIVRRILDEAREANNHGFQNAALLLAWGALEGAARNAHSRIFSKPQSPGRIITVLAERGELNPDEAQELRKLAQLRNSLIHGDFGFEIAQSDVEFIIKIIEKM